MTTLTALEDECLGLMRAAAVDDATFSAFALKLHRFQREHNEPYDKYCAGLGLAESLRDWREIPAVPQSAFKRFPLRSFPETSTTATFRTSGTTGEGFGLHHFSSLRLYEAAILHGWDHARLPVLPQIILIPPPAEAPHSSLSHMMGALQSRASEGRQVYAARGDGTLDHEKLRRELESFATRQKPVLLLGAALAFLHWLDHLENQARSFSLPAGSSIFETGGYKGTRRMIPKPDLYRQLAAALAVEPDCIVNEYGMTELSSQLYARGIEGLHQPPPWVRVLVIDPETGRETAPGRAGILRIFDLANTGSVLAVETQDLAIQREGGIELLGRDPSALPRGCSRPADEILSQAGGR